MFNIFYINALHYFFTKNDELFRFCKMSNFHQNYKFPRNVWSLFGEKWVLHAWKTSGVNVCTGKFTEENIVFT